MDVTGPTPFCNKPHEATMNTNIVTNIIAIILALAFVAYAAYLASIGTPIGYEELVGSIVTIGGVFFLGKAGTRTKMLIGFASILFLLNGCGAATTSSLDLESQTITTANQGDGVGGITATADGRPIVMGKNLGVGTSAAWTDTDGIVMTTPGPVATMVFNPTTNQFQITSQRDSTIGSFKYTPNPAAGQPAVEATNISMNMSAPLSQLVSAVNTYWPILQNMTKTEADKQIAEWQAAGQITSDIASILGNLAAKFLVP